MPKMMAEKFLQRRRRHRHEWVFLFGLLLSVGLYLGYSLYKDYQTEDTLQRQRLLRETGVIESTLVSQIAAANRVMESVRENWLRLHQERDGLALLNRRLQVISSVLPGVGVMLVIDAQGKIMASNDYTFLGDSVAHRDWFQLAARTNRVEQLYVTPPVKSVLNTLEMGLLRTITGPRGEFAGVVYASLDPAYAKTVLASVLYTPDTQAVLVHGAGTLFMHEPERKDLQGKDLAVPGSLFTRHRDSGQSTSMMVGKVAVTDDQRILAQRTIWPPRLNMDQPLVVAVSRDLDAVFEPWRSHALQDAGLFVLFGVTFCTTLFLYQRHQRLYHRVADRKQAALESGHALLAEAQRLAKVGSWELDLASNTLTWSDEISRLFEIDKQQFRGTYEAFLDAIHPDDRAAVNQAYTDSLAHGKPYEITHRLLMPDGRIKWVQERGTSDFDEHGKPLRSRGTVQDISEIHDAQAALRQLNAELEQRVALRTAELTGAVVQAKRLSTAKSNFLSHISHELRTPLNAVIGFAHLLKTDTNHPLPPDQRDSVQDILQAGQHLLELVNGLLDLNRIESGNLKLDIEPVDLAPQIEQCVSQVRALALQRGIVVQVDPVVSEAAMVDPVRLRQVLLNLLSNAIKYNRPDGGVRVQVSMLDGARVRVAISDTGYGIPPERLDELFLPFNRLGAERGTIDGIGIGLIITRHVVEQMGGSIGFESEVGVGSKFWVELPCAGIEPTTTPAMPAEMVSPPVCD